MDLSVAFLAGTLLLDRNPVTVPVYRRPVVFRYSQVSAWETSLPEGIPPTRLIEAPTGVLTVEQPVAALIRTATSFLRALEALPIDQADDDFVNELVSRRTSGRTARPLVPRLRA